jgi:dienelactone hydrolase
MPEYETDLKRLAAPYLRYLYKNTKHSFLNDSTGIYDKENVELARQRRFRSFHKNSLK